MAVKKLSRRQFLYGAGVAATATVLAACQATPTPVPTAAPTKAAATAVPAATAAPTKAAATAAATAAPTKAATTAAATAAPTAAAQTGKCVADWTPTFPAFKKNEPSIKISTIAGDAPKFIGKDTMTDNVMTRRLKENTGIEYTIEWQASGDVATQKMQAAIASGTLPEMFQTSSTDLAKMIENGALEDIKAVWEATASDLVKTKKQYPAGKNWVPVQYGDKLYGIAFSFGPGYNVDNLGWIRQDFLDKIGAKMPSTLDELTTVLKAFKSNKLSTFGINACKNLVTWYQSLDPVFGAFGVMPTCWMSQADGTLAYGSTLPAVKDALAVIAAWYKDGILDPDFYNYGEGDAANNIGAGKVGAFFGPWWTVGALLAGIEPKNTGMKYVTMPAPKGPNGKQGRIASGIAGPAVVFKKGIAKEKLVAAIQQLNWQLDMHINWEKYQQYGEQRNSNAFAQGYDWDFDDACALKAGPVDNTYVFMDGVGMGFPNMCYPDYQVDINKDILKWYDKDVKTLNKGQQYLMKNPTVKREAETYLEVYNTLSWQIPNEFLGVNTPNMVKYLPDLSKMESEYLIGIVTGNKPITDFDKFVKEWKAAGGDTVTKDVNDWKKSKK